MTLCPLISKFHPLAAFCHLFANHRIRYEIEGDAPAWEGAEKQVLKAAKEGRSTGDVSVKSGKDKKKRKAGQTANEVYEEAFGEKTRKKHKKGKKAE